MEDVITDVPPPSRFSPDDLDNFAAPPAQPTPILVVSPNPSPPTPRLLIVFISPTSLALLASPPPLHASLLLPDLPLHPHSHAPIRVYLHPSGALLAAAHGAVPAHRARAAAKALVSRLQPEEVLVLDAVRSGSYRGRLAADEPVEGKLETRAARARGGVGAARAVAALAPPGSVVDGLGAAVLAECEIRGKAASMVVTWPAGARPAEFVVTRRVAEEIGVDTGKAAARVSGRPELDALYT
ncbi:hypothetical protein BDA96_03G018200 [Sorghum bicolor]|uniref:Uncharacterized protein n=2 Tax=Sorghum bicolor TaxID=4558 RepID=A0A921R8Y1_SORBI|nr:uncharacterized protein LOC8081395 [Sorghum bicolor]KAG0535906.1 hypothetical protein BDA96_03G018200 [Sorghum bicolor]KXG31546.1 hypothetical protein SORBI_3003G016400 [Sorghum bicolor]|eukprot:XP_002457122.2 uncharacterized protein LOC8081395 [Sorghum bicolor]